jgi:hypothetical protein
MRHASALLVLLFAGCTPAPLSLGDAGVGDAATPCGRRCTGEGDICCPYREGAGDGWFCASIYSEQTCGGCSIACDPSPEHREACIDAMCVPN